MNPDLLRLLGGTAAVLVVASAVAPWTERLRYLVAVRPGLQSPSVAARMTATLDRLIGAEVGVGVHRFRTEHHAGVEMHHTLGMEAERFLAGGH